MTELAEVKVTQEVILRKLSEVTRIFLNTRPPMTRRQFATAANLSYTTVCRKVWDGEIAEKDGRIPAKYLDAYLS